MIKSWIFEQVNVSTSADAGLFDAATFQHELGWRQRTWIDAEALGFHGIFFSEHHFSGVRVSPCPSMLAAAVAARTTVLRIGVLGWVLPLWQPWRFLEKVGMLDHLSQGRLEIGVARGSNPLEAEAVGVAVEDVGPMFDEALDILDKAWTEPTLSHRGRYWSFDCLPVLPRRSSSQGRRCGVPCAAWPRRGGRGAGYGACTGFLPTSEAKAVFDGYRDAVSARDARLRRQAGPAALRVRGGQRVRGTGAGGLGPREDAVHPGRRHHRRDAAVRDRADRAPDARDRRRQHHRLLRRQP